MGMDPHYERARMSSTRPTRSGVAERVWAVLEGGRGRCRALTHPRWGGARDRSARKPSATPSVSGALRAAELEVGSDGGCGETRKAGRGVPTGERAPVEWVDALAVLAWAAPAGAAWSAEATSSVD